MNVVSRTRNWRCAKVRPQEPEEAGSSSPLTKMTRPFPVQEHGLGQGSPLQLIQSLKGLTTEGSLLTPLPAAGAMSPFLIGSLGRPSQSPPYLFWETKSPPTQLAVSQESSHLSPLDGKISSGPK